MYFNYIYFKKRIYIFCLWIWILSVLYLLNISKFSTLFLSFLALLFTILRQITYKIYNINYYIIIFEIILVLIVYYKHFKIDKKKLIDYKNILYSFLLFLIYLLFLKLTINKNFYQYYFEYLK